MDVFWQELTSGLHDSKQLAQVVIRLVAATLLGAIVGFQRESSGRPAGLRTHLLVSLGTALQLDIWVEMKRADVEALVPLLVGKFSTGLVAARCATGSSECDVCDFTHAAHRPS